MNNRRTIGNERLDGEQSSEQETVRESECGVEEQVDPGLTFLLNARPLFNLLVEFESVRVDRFLFRTLFIVQTFITDRASIAHWCSCPEGALHGVFISNHT